MMSMVLRLTDTVAKEEVSGLPTALKLGATVFLTFALLLFLVTRLNQDR